MTSVKKSVSKTNKKKTSASIQKNTAKSKKNKDTVKKTPLEKFVTTVSKSKKIWGVHGNDGWVVCDALLTENKGVIPFWSTKKAAELHCVEEWGDYSATLISLEEFLDFWLVEVAHDGLLFGLEWNRELRGEEIDPVNLEAEFLRQQ